MSERTEEERRKKSKQKTEKKEKEERPTNTRRDDSKTKKNKETKKERERKKERKKQRKKDKEKLKILTKKQKHDGERKELTPHVFFQGLELSTMEKVDSWFTNQLNREKWLQLYHTNVNHLF